MPADWTPLVSIWISIATACVLMAVDLWWMKRRARKQTTVSGDLYDTIESLAASPVQSVAGLNTMLTAKPKLSPHDALEVMAKRRLTPEEIRSFYELLATNGAPASSFMSGQVLTIRCHECLHPVDVTNGEGHDDGCPLWPTWLPGHKAQSEPLRVNVEAFMREERGVVKNENATKLREAQERRRKQAGLKLKG